MNVTAVRFNATIGTFTGVLWNCFAFIVALLILAVEPLVLAVSFVQSLAGLNGKESTQGMILKSIGARMLCQLSGFHASIVQSAFQLLEASLKRSFAQKIAPTKARRYQLQLSIARFVENLLSARKRMAEATLMLSVFALKTVQIKLDALEALIKMGTSFTTGMVSPAWNIVSLCRNILGESFKNMKTCITKMVCAMTTKLKIWSCGARSNPKGSVSKIKSHGALSFFVNMGILSRACQVTKSNFLD